LNDPSHHHHHQHGSLSTVTSSSVLRSFNESLLSDKEVRQQQLLEPIPVPALPHFTAVEKRPNPLILFNVTRFKNTVFNIIILRKINKNNKMYITGVKPQMFGVLLDIV
jgi:hypothetical protein